MALKIKAITIRIPNLDKDPDVPDQEKEIEDAVKSKLNAGYTYIGMAGGDNFATIIFTKTE
jgi:hypothetical protein